MNHLLYSASIVSSCQEAIINLKNADDECFKWAITRALNPVENILNVLIKNFEKHQRSSIGRDRNFQSIYKHQNMIMLDMCALDVLILSIPRKSLAFHHDYCKSYEAIKIELLKEVSKISFKNHIRSMRVPFIVYANFEFFTPQLSTSQPNPEKSYTNQYQKHMPSGFCYHIKYFDDTL